jgi:transcriptional regulator with XRE-family HTH domain
VASSASPTVRRRRLAAELRRLRGTRTAAPVAKALGWSIAKISRYENGAGNFPIDEVAKLLEYYDVLEPRRGRLLALAEDANQRGWWDEYSDALGSEYMELIGLEAEAESVISWCITLVPGLLQTEEYAREVFASYQKTMPIAPGLIERRVRVRLIRQDVLTTRQPPLKLSVVLDESALLRRTGGGGPKVMHEQLQRLMAVSELPNVELRILPFSSGASPPPGPFEVFGFPAEDVTAKLGDVLVVEGMTGQLSVEGETDTDTYVYRLFFETLRKAALSPDESRALILRTTRSVWSLPSPRPAPSLIRGFLCSSRHQRRRSTAPDRRRAPPRRGSCCPEPGRNHRGGQPLPHIPRSPS